MKRVKMIIRRILYPTNKIWLIIPLVSYMTLIFIFAQEKTESTLAYPSYCMSAYSLSVLCIAAPKKVRKLVRIFQNSNVMRRLLSLGAVNRRMSDVAFRGNISIYQGMTVNFLYMIFRMIMGIRYTSIWFVSMAAYYLLLGVIRAYLIICYKQRNMKDETVCYRNTAWFLFLLNVPMGGMIVLMVRTNSGFSYPGYVIYLSALYTVIIAVRNIVKFRKIGSPILSAAKVLNFIAAMMSILGLQTAMISQFSTNGENYRKMMNGITGGFVHTTVIVIALYMLFYRNRSYIMAFYVKGLMAIIIQWLKNDCKESVEHIIEVMQECVKQK